MVKIKLHRIISQEFTNAYNKLMKEPLPMKTAYKLKNIALVVNSEQGKYEELRKELLIRLGKKDENGELILKDGAVELEGNGEEYKKAYAELVNIDVEVDGVSIDELGDSKISASDLICLGELITAHNT